MMADDFDSSPADVPAPVRELRGVWDEASLRAKLATAVDDDETALWTRALAHHNLAALGIRGEASRADVALKRLLAIKPDDALVLAYLGNTRIMAARDSFNLLGKPAMVRAGLAHLDRAVELAPDHVSVRLLRAGSGKRLPKLFNRRAHVLADLRHVAALLNASGDDPQTLAEVQHDLDELAGDNGEPQSDRIAQPGGSK